MPVDHGRAIAEQAALAFGKPKILYYYGYDCGCAIAAESLPVSKYWALQNNATMEMALHQDSILASGSADIVIFQTNHWTFRPSETAEDIAARITAAGYNILQTSQSATRGNHVHTSRFQNRIDTTDPGTHISVP